MLEAELWGVLHGLRTAWDAGWRKVIMEFDSTSAVKLLKSNINKGHPLENSVRRIKDILNREWQLFIRHILWEGNEAADCCAALGLEEALGLHAISNTWPRLEEILQRERVCVGRSRLVRC